MEDRLSITKEKLIKTLKSFTQFCEENDITYYAAYGTLIGAIRHKGFIPWDDDIDVYMTRSNYDKFISLKNKLNNSGYAICNYEDEPYPYPFAKYYSTDMTFWEYRHFPFIIGSFIDIIPMEEVPGKTQDVDQLNEKTHEIFWKYRKSIAWHPWSEIYEDIKKGAYLDSCVKIYKKLRYTPFKNRYKNKIRDLEEKARLLSGEYYKPFVFSLKVLYKKEWFSSTIDWPFEDTIIKVPQGYHDLLTHVFGNYMELPPKEKQIAQHYAYYENFSKKMSIEEILKEKQSDFIIRDSLNMHTLIDEIRHKTGFKY